MLIKYTTIGATAVAALMLAAAPSFAQTQKSPSSPPPYESSQGAQSTPGSTGQMQQSSPSGTRSSTMGSSSTSSATNTAATVPLSQVQNPSTTLASAQVQDSSGQTVGQVQKVQTTSAGHVSKINVTLSTGTSAGKTVAIPASDLTFDQGGNILKARLTQSEIEKLKGSTSSTNPM